MLPWRGLVLNVVRSPSPFPPGCPPVWQVVELSTGTHRVADELRRHSLSDGEGGHYSTNLDRNRYGSDNNYLFTGGRCCLHAAAAAGRRLPPFTYIWPFVERLSLILLGFVGGDAGHRR